MIPLVQSDCFQPKFDLLIIFKMNLPNNGDKWKVIQTACTDVFPTIAGNMSVCLHGGVSATAAEHSSLKHISTEQTVDQVSQKETQLGRNRYGKPS